MERWLNRHMSWPIRWICWVVSDGQWWHRQIIDDCYFRSAGIDLAGWNESNQSDSTRRNGSSIQMSSDGQTHTGDPMEEEWKDSLRRWIRSNTVSDRHRLSQCIWSVPSNVFRSQILNIKDLRQSDTGNYTCELFNAFGTLNATYVLLVTGTDDDRRMLFSAKRFISRETALLR